MSSLYVRQLVRQWITASSTVPFYDSINRAVDPADAIWLTLEFDNARTDSLTFCSEIERGTFSLVYVGAGGVGDVPILTQIALDLPALMAQVDPAGRLELIEASPPEELTDGDGSPYMLGVSIDYQYQPA